MATSVRLSSLNIQWEIQLSNHNINSIHPNFSSTSIHQVSTSKFLTSVSLSKHKRHPFEAMASQPRGIWPTMTVRRCSSPRCKRCSFTSKCSRSWKASSRLIGGWCEQNGGQILDHSHIGWFLFKTNPWTAFPTLWASNCFIFSDKYFNQNRTWGLPRVKHSMVWPWEISLCSDELRFVWTAKYWVCLRQKHAYPSRLQIEKGCMPTGTRIFGWGRFRLLKPHNLV